MARNYAKNGTAGALFIIGILLTSMVYNSNNGTPNIPEFDSEGILVTSHNVMVGDVVRFNINTYLLAPSAAVQFFMFDFHDGSGITVLNKTESSISHTFSDQGKYTVSMLAIKPSASKVYTTVINVKPEIQGLKVSVSSKTAEEMTKLTLSVDQPLLTSPITNFLWEFGDGSTAFGTTITHEYSKPGLYKIRVKGIAVNNLVYVGYNEVTITNKVPAAAIRISSSNLSVDEDHQITLRGNATDTSNDMSSLRYVWDFGDGLFGTGINATHSYAHDGTYKVKFHVIDNNNAIGTASVNIAVHNKVPVITSLTSARQYYSQGETIKTIAKIDETLSDQGLLTYDWSNSGNGTTSLQPYYQVGTKQISLQVTDDNGATDTTSTSFDVINVHPYVSLIDAYSSFNVTFNSWGTTGSVVNVTLSSDNVPRNNTVFTNTHSAKVDTNVDGSLMNLKQELTQYWDFHINITNSVAFDNFVELTFHFADGSSTSLINEFSSACMYCLAPNARFPVAPIDRGFPVTYNFSYFDPGSDNLTLNLNMDGTLYSQYIPASTGPTSGTTAIVAKLAPTKQVTNIRYQIQDDYSATSQDNQLSLINYALEQPPADYVNMTNWSYSGYGIRDFAPVAIWESTPTLQVGQDYTFKLLPQYPQNGTINYIWHFGTGDQSIDAYPSYSYAEKGTYMVWVVLKTQYYEYVQYMMVDVYDPVAALYPIKSGMPHAGENLNFTTAGLVAGEHSDYLISWDFGDGTFGFGNFTTHVYTRSGNYTAVMTVIDQYNQQVTSSFNVYILPKTPGLVDTLSTDMTIKEGTAIVLEPQVKDGAYDILNMNYSWMVDGVEYTTPTLSINQATSTSIVFMATNADGISYNQTINVEVQQDPVSLSVPSVSKLYGSTDAVISLYGNIVPSVYLNGNYRSTTEIHYTFYSKANQIYDQGTGQFSANDTTFEIGVNTTKVADKAVMDQLNKTIQTLADLTPDKIPSGQYTIQIELRDKNTNKVLVTSSITLDITVDTDGDFITNTMEVLFSKRPGASPLNYNSTDSNHNGIADPVEYVLGKDADGDGLPTFYENYYHTNVNSSDTDHDGLTDGFGPRGELTLGTNPLKADTDGDGIPDGVEVTGWQVKVSTPIGLMIIHVTSNPLSNDTDHDGISDGMEMKLGSNPRSNDSDHDHVLDKVEQNSGTNLLNFDTDFDGISDYNEMYTVYNTTYTDVNGTVHVSHSTLNPLSKDTDHDGINDFKEVFVYHSNPTSRDTDSDGLNDSSEVNIYHTNILKSDTDADGLTDGIEIQGFDIPIISMSAGVYAEDGSIITHPVATKYVVHVSSNPLLADSDGDGISDYKEVTGNATTISNPMSADSDHDGIIDPFDSQRLITDYTPPSVVAGTSIGISYSIQPGRTTQLITNTLVTSLTTVWNLMKGFGNLVSNILSRTFYWSCDWWIGDVCGWWSLHIRSYWDWAQSVVNDMLSFIRSHVTTVFPAAPNYSNWYLDGLSFPNFGMTLQKDWAGIPNGLSFSGTANLVVSTVLTPITSIVSPTINFNMNLRDDSGIQRIKIFQDGVWVRDINNIYNTIYTLNVALPIASQGAFTLKPTTFRFEISDYAGNTRVITRTTGAVQFSQGWLDQGWTLLQETAPALTNVLQDVWDWTLGAANYLGTGFVNAVNDVGTFVQNTWNTITTWFDQQFTSIWENFVRNTITALARKYSDDAVSAFATLGRKFTSLSSTISDSLAGITDGTLFDSVGGALDSFKNQISSSLPSTDISAVSGSVGDIGSGIASAIGDSVVVQAIAKIGNDAMNIITKIIEGYFSDLIKASMGRYMNMLSGPIAQIISLINLDPSNISVSALTGSADLGSDFTSILTGIVDSASGAISATQSLMASVPTSALLAITRSMFVDDTSLPVSFNDIMVGLFSPFVGAAFAFSDLLSLTGLSSPDLFQVSALSLDQSQTWMNSSLNGLSRSDNEQLQAILFAMSSGALVIKEFISSPSDATDRGEDISRADNDLETQPLPGDTLAPHTFGGILNVLLGTSLGITATIMANTPSVADTKEKVDNYNRIAANGYEKLAIGLLRIGVTEYLRAHNVPSTQNHVDFPALSLTWWTYLASFAFDVVSTSVSTSILASNSHTGLLLTAKVMENVALWLSLIREALNLFTNNGDWLVGSLATAFQAFRAFYIGFRLTSNLLLYVATTTG